MKLIESIKKQAQKLIDIKKGKKQKKVIKKKSKSCCESDSCCGRASQARPQKKT